MSTTQKVASPEDRSTPSMLDVVLAEKLRKTVEELNDHIAGAHDAGLQVEIDAYGMMHTHRGTYPVIKIKITREL